MAHCAAASFHTFHHSPIAQSLVLQLPNHLFIYLMTHQPPYTILHLTYLRCSPPPLSKQSSASIYCPPFTIFIMRFMPCTLPLCQTGHERWHSGEWSHQRGKLKKEIPPPLPQKQINSLFSFIKKKKETPLIYLKKKQPKLPFRRDDVNVGER